MGLRALATALICMGFAASAQAQSALNDILSDGVLRVGTTGDWNPMTVRDPATNTFKGFDIDVMSELASDLGVELEMVPTDWKTLVNGVVAGSYHMTGSASITPARMKAAGFSDTYISVEIFPYTTTDKQDRFDGWDSLNQEGVVVATTLGTSFQALANEWFPNAEIKVVEAPARGFQEVLAGRADAFITSNIEGATLTEKFPFVRVANTAPRAPAPIAMLLPQTDQVWINYVNDWITLKQMSGFFDTTKAKWGL